MATELLPLLAGKVDFIFRWLFGFNASELVAFPITALGTVGAALGLIPEMMSKGIITHWLYFLITYFINSILQQ